MLFYHGLGEFPIVGFLRFEIPTGDILLPRLGQATDQLSLAVFLDPLGVQYTGSGL